MRFFSVVKPGIIFGNIVTLCGGFFLGSRQGINFTLLFMSMIGLALVIASGCVFNNYVDRDIDQLMERTKNRVLVQGLIAPRVAFLYATLLGVAGFLILYFQVNTLAAVSAFIGFFVYVILYTLRFKRHSSYGTLIGGIAGAMPPVVGYVAATNHFDLAAALLFLILFFWQMPHFYAIAIYRLSDFSAAAIPVLPLKKTIPYTKISMLIYTVAFAITAVLPSFLGFSGFVYGITAAALGIIWIILGVKGYLNKLPDQIWARKMFLFSILNITLLCLAMAVKV